MSSPQSEESQGNSKYSAELEEERLGNSKYSAELEEESQGNSKYSAELEEESLGNSKYSVELEEESLGNSKYSAELGEESQGNSKYSVELQEESQGNSQNSAELEEESLGNSRYSAELEEELESMSEESQGNSKYSAELEEELESMSCILNKEEFSYARLHQTSQVSVEMTVTPLTPEGIKLILDGATSDENIASLRHLTPVRLTAILPQDYPVHPPKISNLEAEWINTRVAEQVKKNLDSLWETDCVVLYLWYSELLDNTLPLALEDGSVRVDTKEVFNRLVDHNEEKDLDTFQECQICYNQGLAKHFTRLECGHSFCEECMKSYLKARFQEGRYHKLNCPSEDCAQEVGQRMVQRLASVDSYDKYEKSVLDGALAAIPNTCWCPRFDCQYLAEVEPDSHLGQCPQCGFSFCTVCLKLNHGVSNCYMDLDTDEAAHLIENQKDLMKRHEVDIREVKALKNKYGEYAWAEKLDYLTSEVFDNLSGKSQLEIFNRYTGDDSKDKEVLEELYGTFLLDAFVAKMKRLLVFGDYFRDSSTFHEGDRDTKKTIYSLCKPCPNCRVPTEKNEGCSHMFCVRCSTHWNWDSCQVMTFE